MGFSYNYSLVHDRVIIWWTDNFGRAHEIQFDGETAAELAANLQSLGNPDNLIAEMNTKIQDVLAQTVARAHLQDG